MMARFRAAECLANSARRSPNHLYFSEEPGHGISPLASLVLRSEKNNHWALGLQQPRRRPIRMRRVFNHLRGEILADRLSPTTYNGSSAGFWCRAQGPSTPPLPRPATITPA